MGFFEMIMSYTKVNTSEGFYPAIIKLFVGVAFLVFSIISHVKYNANRKQLEREMSKEYDERDDLIEGKSSQFTMSVLMAVALLMMFLLRWIPIPTNTALFVIIIVTLITSALSKKYYSYFL